VTVRVSHTFPSRAVTATCVPRLSCRAALLAVLLGGAAQFRIDQDQGAVRRRVALSAREEAAMKLAISEFWQEWQLARSILCQQRVVLEAGCVDWTITEPEKAAAIHHLDNAVHEISALLRSSGSA
jgi:hypothetical protein